MYPFSADNWSWGEVELVLRPPLELLERNQSPHPILQQVQAHMPNLPAEGTVRIREGGIELEQLPINRDNVRLGFVDFLRGKRGHFLPPLTP